MGRLVQGLRCQRQNGADISEHLGRGTRIPPAFRGRKTPNRGKVDMAARSSSSASAVDASRIWPSHLFLDSYFLMMLVVSRSLCAFAAPYNPVW